MSITKNVFRLNKVYDLVLSAQWVQYDTSLDPGTLWSWGYNSCGQLGQNDLVNRSSPVQIPGTEWNNIFASSNFSLARKNDGSLWAWGSNNYGRLGDNTVIKKSLANIKNFKNS